MWIIYVVRALQVASILLGLLGGGNALACGAKVFGSSGVATTWDGLATFMPIIGAAVSWAVSHFLGWKLTTPAITELMAALIAYGRSRSDENKRRLIIAIIPVAKELVGSLEALVVLSKTLDGLDQPSISGKRFNELIASPKGTK